MRVFVLLALSAATFLLPQVAAADPAQPEATPAVTATSAAVPSPTTTQVAAPAAPQQVAQTPAPAADAGGDEIVCKSLPPTTGTRLGGGRECHTAHEWNERMKESQDMVKKTQMDGHLGALSGPAGK